MKGRNFFSLTLSSTVLISAMAMSLIITWFVSRGVFIWMLPLYAAAAAVAVYFIKKRRKDIEFMLKAAVKRISGTDRKTLDNFAIPVVITAAGGEIIWKNKAFSDIIPSDIYGQDIGIILGTDHESFAWSEGNWIEYQEKLFRVFGQRNNSFSIFFFIEDTELKRMADEYKLTRPCVMFIQTDNYEELMQNAKESEKSRLLGEIDTVFEECMSETTGFMIKLKSDRFIALLEERDIEKMVKDKFPLLTNSRKIMANGSVPLTISLGIGKDGKTFSENERLARQGLDMALGRGGDQVALRTPDGYDFFGGASKGYEKRTKVKSRVIANALSELVKESDNVIVMGHRFSDLDAVGSAAALACGIRDMGKTAYVAIDTEKTLAMPLIERLEEAIPGLFIHPNTAVSFVNKNTLLIIVDTHSVGLLESEELYSVCGEKAVIDHHRKKVDFIEDAVIFYHEPYASSASEMVTELLQYMSDKELIGKAQAEALLAGIMLDTKNFLMKTGVRTFEAAAYLRRRGADTSHVRWLFTSTMDSYQRRVKLISSAAVYRGCAITVSDTVSDDLRIIAPQAADELLNISDVNASFVIYKTDDTICISARSLGNINVQLIMEKLGGGGHMNMAAAQLPGIDFSAANDKLISAIDSYLDE